MNQKPKSSLKRKSCTTSDEVSATQSSTQVTETRLMEIVTVKDEDNNDNQATRKSVANTMSMKFIQDYEAVEEEKLVKEMVVAANDDDDKPTRKTVASTRSRKVVRAQETVEEEKLLKEKLVKEKPPLTPYKKKSTVEDPGNSASVQATPKVNRSKSPNQSTANKTYSFAFKKNFLETYQRLSTNHACLLHGVSIDVASKWIKNFKKEGYVGLIDKRQRNGREHSSEFDEYILNEFKKRRDRGLLVNGVLIQAIAMQGPHYLKAADFRASNGWLYRFLKRNKITRRRTTHRTMAVIDNLNREIRSYFSTIETLKDYAEDIIFVNFDETPLPYDLSSNYTYHFAGEKDVPFLSHPQSKTQATATLCIASNGDILPPLLTFVYAYQGKSARKFPRKYEKYQNITNPHFVRFSDSGFNKDWILQDYVEKVILAWKSRQNKEVVLIIDQAKCHMSHDFIHYLDTLKMTYIFIPSGYTSVLQPLDVVINKPFKDEMRASYLVWLEAQVANITVRQVLPPNEDNIMDWVAKALVALTTNMVTESFRLTALTGSLEELRDKTNSTQKMAQLLSRFDEDVEETAEYMDPVEKEVESILLEQELYIEDSAAL